MSLERLNLAQFRSWGRLDLQMPRPVGLTPPGGPLAHAEGSTPLAIFGPNGAGKTNILEAMSMLSPGRGLRGAAPGDQGRQAAGAGWRVRAVIAGREVETGAAPGESRGVTLDGKAVPQAALGGLLRVIWLVPAMDRLWTEAPEGRRRFLDRMTLSFLPSHAEAALAYDKAMRERNRLLREQVADAGWYRALEAQMAEAGAALTANRLAALARLAEAQAGDAADFPAARLALLPGEGFADDPDAEALAARLAEGRRRDLAAGRSLVGPHRADLGAVWGPGDMPAALASTGEQKALLLSLILANARALADSPVLLLLDEVAAHLDTGRRGQLYDAVCRLPAQTVLTGTGPELFAELEGRAMMMQVTKDADASRAEVLA